MAMVGVIGFDNYLNGAITPNYINTKMNLLLAAGGTKTVDMLQQRSGTAGQLVLNFELVKDPYSTTLNALKTLVVSGWSDNPLSGFNGDSIGWRIPLSDTTLNRTGTWVFGCWIGTGPTRTGSGSRGLAGFVGQSTNEAANGVAIAANSMSWVEVVVDWVANQVRYYKDGVLVTTTPYMTTDVMVGCIRMVGGGGYNYATVGNGEHYYTRDVYFAMNPTDDPNPVNRLSRVRVQGHKVASIQSNRWGTNSPSKDKVESLNALIGPTNTIYTTTDPLSTPAIIKFDQFEAPPEYSQPLFLQVAGQVTMDSAAGVNIQHRIGNGTLKTDTLSANLPTNIVDTAAVTSQADVAAVEYKINSIPV